jgi:hypothetical protein
MTTWYRALRVVAIVTLLGAALNALYLHWWASNPANSSPAQLLLIFWPLIDRMFLPILGVLSVIVAAQARAWAWLITFVVTGLIGWQGLPLLLLFLERSSFMQTNLAHASLLVALYVYGQPILEAIPALLALVFVWLKMRANAATQGGAAVI